MILRVLARSKPVVVIKILIRRTMVGVIKTVILHPRISLVSLVGLLAVLWLASSGVLNPGQNAAVGGADAVVTDVSAASEMTVVGLGQDRDSGRTILLLKEKDSDRYLALWIRQTEALAIATQLDRTNVTRPQSHDLLNSAIAALGGKVVRVVVTDFTRETFYARVVLAQGGAQSIELDARPSDAIALALRAEVPIYSNRALLDKLAIKYAPD